MNVRANGDRAISLLRSLCECATTLLRVRDLFDDGLLPYRECIDAALAQIVEAISGVGTEIVGDCHAGNDNVLCEAFIFGEPMSNADAVRKLAGFLENVSIVIDDRTVLGSVVACAMAARAQTFAFWLAPEKGGTSTSDMGNGK